MIRNSNIARLLLNYILTARGICHENALILALIRLKIDFDEFDPSWTIQKWNLELNEVINEINIKLSTLNYKIVKISHGMGKNAVTLKNKQRFGLFEKSNMDGSEENNNYEDDIGADIDGEVNAGTVDKNNNNMSSIILPESNKFYVYINMESSEETKLATRFQEKEISFIKWAIDQFVNNGMQIQSISNNTIDSNIIYKEINQLLNSLSYQQKGRRRGLIDDDDDDSDEEAYREQNNARWNYFISFTSRSTKLLQYENMGATEIEDLLLQLCELKWLYRDSNGRFGMDLRCIAELRDYLINEYALPLCQQCQQLTLQGVICGNADCCGVENRGQDSIFQRRVWHLDCFQHYMLHVDQNCDKCNSSLLKNCIYII